VDVLRPLKLAKLSGPEVARIGATAELVHRGKPYDSAQAWSGALHRHPGTFDGIAYTARHDDEVFCYEIFEHAAGELRGASRQTDFDQDRFWDIADIYGAGHVPCSSYAAGNLDEQKTSSRQSLAASAALASRAQHLPRRSRAPSCRWTRPKPVFQVIVWHKPTLADLDATQSSSAHFLVNLPPRNPDYLGRLLNAQRQAVGQWYLHIDRTRHAGEFDHQAACVMWHRLLRSIVEPPFGRESARTTAAKATAPNDKSVIAAGVG
jgi:hypothetical protein